MPRLCFADGTAQLQLHADSSVALVLHAAAMLLPGGCRELVAVSSCMHLHGRMLLVLLQLHAHSSMPLVLHAAPIGCCRIAAPYIQLCCCCCCCCCCALLLLLLRSAAAAAALCCCMVHAAPSLCCSAAALPSCSMLLLLLLLLFLLLVYAGCHQLYCYWVPLCAAAAAAGPLLLLPL
jgi:hypothetical protein